VSVDHDERPPAAPSGHEAASASPDGAMSGAQWIRLAVVVGLLAWLTVATGVYGLAMVLGIMVMIFLHELGHFVMAKRAGMKVTEFFLGFGPRIWSVQRGETEYGLKLIPAGAYVKIIGMHDIEEVDAADEARTYRQKPFWQRFGVAVAGSTVHFGLALILIYVLLVGFGVRGGSLTDPDLTTWRVAGVANGTAADDAGLREGDDIVAIDGRAVATFDDLREVVRARPTEEVTLTVERAGRRRSVDTTLGRRTVDGEVEGYLGTGETLPVQRQNALEGVPGAFEEMGRVLGLTVKGLGSFFTPGGISDFGGQVINAGDEPVEQPEQGSGAGQEEETGENRLLSLLGLFRIGVGLGSTNGAVALITLFAFINAFIGIFNLLPMLPFDGGHVVIAIYEKIQEKRKGLSRRYFADVAKLLPMTYAVVAVLAVIFVSSLYLDILKPLEVN